MAEVPPEEIAPDDGFSEVEGPFPDTTEQDNQKCNESGDSDASGDQKLPDGEKEDFDHEAFQYEGHTEEEEEEEELTPLMNLRKHAHSDVICNRQLAVRKIVDVLSSISIDNELHGVVSIICRLSEDAEEVVRSELVDHIPEIATFCRNYGPRLEFLIRQQLVPLTVKLCDDAQFQVRTASRLALIELVERNLVDSVLLNEWICPLIVHQTMSMGKNEEKRIEALILMCQVACIVGKELTMKYFLEPFSTLMSCTSLPIKKNCATRFSSFCKIVGAEVTEEILLPKFLSFCQAEQWGLRKQCAESFVDVAALISPFKKKSILTDVFIRLLCDESRWVKFSAYQSLGRFIVTFADPTKTGLRYNEQDGSWTMLNSEDSSEFSSHSELLCSSVDCAYEDPNSPKRTNSFSCESSLSHGQNSSSENVFLNDSNVNLGSSNRYESIIYNIDSSSPSANGPDSKASDVTVVNVSSSAKTGERTVRNESPLSVITRSGHLHVHLDNESVFNNFQFWRLPLPEVELDVDIADGHATSIHIRARTRDERTNQICSSDIRVDISSRRTKTDEPLKIIEENSRLNAEDVRSVAAEVTEMLVQSASVSTVHNPSPANDGSGQNSSVMQSTFDEAHLTLVDGELKELKQSHNDLCSPDQKCSYNPFEVSSLYSNSISSEDPSLTPSFSQITYEGVDDQDIVPPELLKKYIGMAEPLLSHLVDSEITRYCAYSLPAVAYTLGRKNWLCLSKLCELLASDMQWKVRRTIAASLHVLAAILGSEIAGSELLQLFFSLINDLDEVRASIIQNLSNFLKHLHYRSRKKFLPHLKRFLKMDNEHNWRFRHTFVTQLIPLTKLYYHSDVEEYIYPVAMFLIRDRVCEVRLETIRLIAVIVSKLSVDETKVKSIISDLKFNLGCSHKWLWRQTFILICQQFAIEHSLSAGVFTENIATSLLSFAWDRVPNVRLALARCLSEALPLDYLNEIERCHGDKLAEVISLLQDDVDRDVRSFANMSLISSTFVQDMLSPV